MSKVQHFEIPTRDAEAAKAFYGPLFGWTFTDWSSPQMQYWGITTGPIDEKTRQPSEPGYISGGLFAGPFMNPFTPISYSAFYVTIDSIDATLEKAVQLGGKVAWPKTNIGSGFVAGITDKEGNNIGIFEMNK